MPTSPHAAEEPSAAPAEERLHCPFCGSEEVERLTIDQRLVVVFPCMFSPVLDPRAPEGLELQLRTYAREGPSYFQKQCDRLHYFVTKGAGAVLPDREPSTADAAGAPAHAPGS